MSLSGFGDKRSVLGLLGAASVIAGVATKNSAWQRGETPAQFGSGTVLFLLGWAIVVLVLNMKGNNLWPGFTKKGILGLVGAALIVAAVMIQQNAKRTGQKVPGWVGLLFVGGWLIIGYTAALKGNDDISPSADNVDPKKGLMSALGVILLLASMILVLPKERKEGVTDTLGMPMFTAGWGLVVLANALILSAAATK